MVDGRFEVSGVGQLLYEAQQSFGGQLPFQEVVLTATTVIEDRRDMKTMSFQAIGIKLHQKSRLRAAMRHRLPSMMDISNLAKVYKQFAHRAVVKIADMAQDHNAVFPKIVVQNT